MKWEEASCGHKYLVLKSIPCVMGILMRLRDERRRKHELNWRGKSRQKGQGGHRTDDGDALPAFSILLRAWRHLPTQTIRSNKATSVPATTTANDDLEIAFIEHLREDRRDVRVLVMKAMTSILRYWCEDARGRAPLLQIDSLSEFGQRIVGADDLPILCSRQESSFLRSCASG